MLNIRVPEGAQKIMDTLSSAGIRSWLVGGCVRDMLRHRIPNDWDIAAGADPDAIVRALDGFRVILTGFRHGTVTVVTEEDCFEVTACRSDGEYKDMRHPESVSFTHSIESDLSRRDFTINAMAYSEKDGLIDLFGGRADLAKGIIRCVGDPDRRFSEDALRIMRALRFASELGFAIDPETALAARRHRENLDAIAQERKLSELRRLMLGRNASAVLLENADILTQIMPEASALVGFPHRPNLPDDLWTHCARSVDRAPAKFNVRMTALLRDIGKPYCRKVGEKYPDHAAVGAHIAEHMLRRMKLDNAALHETVRLIENHSAVPAPDEREIRRALHALGAGTLFDLFELRKSDRGAHIDPEEQAELDAIDEAYALTRRILERGDCYMLSTLAVGGEDLKARGFEGPEIGRKLDQLLSAVIDGECPNEKEMLLARL